MQTASPLVVCHVRIQKTSPTCLDQRKGSSREACNTCPHEQRQRACFANARKPHDPSYREVDGRHSYYTVYVLKGPGLLRNSFHPESSLRATNTDRYSCPLTKGAPTLTHATSAWLLRLPICRSSSCTIDPQHKKLSYRLHYTSVLRVLLLIQRSCLYSARPTAVFGHCRAFDSCWKIGRIVAVTNSTLYYL